MIISNGIVKENICAQIRASKKNEMLLWKSDYDKI